jgi:hypothetical protein
MKALLRSYTAYSICTGIVLAALLLLSQLDSADRRDHIWMVIAGFGLGWLSATIARFVYLPPKKYRLAVNETL